MKLRIHTHRSGRTTAGNREFSVVISNIKRSLSLRVLRYRWKQFTKWKSKWSRGLWKALFNFLKIHRCGSRWNRNGTIFPRFGAFGRISFQLLTNKTPAPGWVPKILCRRPAVANEIQNETGAMQPVSMGLAPEQDRPPATVRTRNAFQVHRIPSWCRSRFCSLASPWLQTTRNSGITGWWRAGKEEIQSRRRTKIAKVEAVGKQTRGGGYNKREGGGGYNKREAADPQREAMVKAVDLLEARKKVDGVKREERAEII